MRRRTHQPVLWSALLLLTTATGCQSTGAGFLSLIGVQKKSVVMALVRSEGAPLTLNPFGPYGQLQTALSKALGYPVPMDICLPPQLPFGLTSGMFHLAMVSPLDYARLPERERFPVLAVVADEAGRTARPALLVVPTNSAIQSVEDLRGKTVVFGRSGDPRTHHAALELFAQHGLKKTDLSLELLPLPGSLKHMPTARAVAQTVINLSSDAGFIDQAAWETLPEHSDSADQPAKDRLRVIAQTIALPDRLVLASPKLDDALRQRVREILLAADREHPEALRPLHVSSYQPPTEELLEACKRLAESSGRSPSRP